MVDPKEAVAKNALVNPGPAEAKLQELRPVDQLVLPICDLPDPTVEGPVAGR